MKKTATKPNTTEDRIATCGTPRRFTVAKALGASPRCPSEKAIREAVYMPELRQDSTAVSTITSITRPAPGMPTCSSTATYGLPLTAAESHGSRVTTSRIEPR